MESCPLVILAEFHPERATYTTLHNHFFYGLSKSTQTFTVGFVKLLSTYPIHIVAWGNFPFKTGVQVVLHRRSIKKKHLKSLELPEPRPFKYTFGLELVMCVRLHNLLRPPPPFLPN